MQEKDEKIEALSNKLESLESDYKLLYKKYESESAAVSQYMTEIDNLKKKLRAYENQKRDLEVLNDQWEQSARILEYSKQELEERLNQAEETAILYKEDYEELSSKKEEETRRLTDQLNELKQELSVFSSEKNDKSKVKPQIVMNEKIFIPGCSNKGSSKPASRNASVGPAVGTTVRESQDISDCSQSVKVVIRVRPPLKGEVWDKTNFSVSDQKIIIKENKPKSESKTFEFENIVTFDQDEDHMYNQINEGISAAMNGKNACILAYGQTGSGKTYTMNSILEKAVSQLSTMNDLEISLQCIEVYNEQVINLCTTDSPSKSKDSLEVPEQHLGKNWQDSVIRIIKDAMTRRTTKFTDCNERSSRSHAIYSLILYSNNSACKIQFVDLAGSERVSKSNVSGETLKEALLINKSLSALQDVISALENKQKHVPYRNSTLTKLLQSTLGGRESVVTMIVNCSPSNESLNETICTLNLASRVKSVDLGFFIRKNLKTQEVERTLTLLEKERGEKNSLLRTLDKLQRDLESYQFAVKDRDNKIAMLNNKIKTRDKGASDSGFKKFSEAPRKGKVEKGKNRNLIYLNIKEVGRVVSHSPKLGFNGMLFNDKPSRIPTPSFVNLRMRNGI